MYITTYRPPPMTSREAFEVMACILMMDGYVGVFADADTFAAWLEVASAPDPAAASRR